MGRRRHLHKPDEAYWLAAYYWHNERKRHKYPEIERKMQLMRNFFTVYKRITASHKEVED